IKLLKILVNSNRYYILMNYTGSLLKNGCILVVRKPRVLIFYYFFYWKFCCLTPVAPCRIFACLFFLAALPILCLFPLGNLYQDTQNHYEFLLSSLKRFGIPLPMSVL